MNNEMYHPPSKRKQLLQRIAVYSLMSITVVGLVSVLVLLMLGYRFNRAEGTIERGGLVQFDTNPDGATVSIDGASFGSQTPSKTTMAAGKHFITMQRDGYQKWQKSVDLVAGSILWLNYARLIPTELTPKNVADFASVTSAAASPDNRWMAIKDDAATPVIRIADLGREDARITDITLPKESFTAPKKDEPQTFTLVEWDPSSQYILVKHTYNDEKKTEWIVVDADNVDSSKNITTLLGVNAGQPKFSNSDSQVLYAIVEGDIRRIDLNSTTLSGPLVENVADFDLFDRSTITYVTKVDPKTKLRSVGYYDDGADKGRTIRSYNDNGKLPLQLAVGRYFGDTYVAIAHGDVLDVFEGDLPHSGTDDPSSLKSVANVSLPGGVDYLSIRTDGRFIVAQQGAEYTVYDLELKKLTTTKLQGTAPVTSKIEWLDNYMVWSDRDSTVRLYEFDGANQHDIMKVVKGLDVTLSPSDKYIYGFTKSDDEKLHLTRVQLEL